MIQTIYIIILSYFILGGVGFYFINRRKPKEIAKASYTKYISYFFIINIIFFSITIEPSYFQYLATLIIGMGVIELLHLFIKSRYQQKLFFTLSLVVYAILSFGFYNFSKLPSEEILFAFLILSIFDSFSQITGQLWGRTKLLPSISPNKTLGGSIGGSIVATISAVLLRDLVSISIIQLLLLTVGIIILAFLGDIAASLYKRKFNVKDYNKLIPGHGGFLDRFDSLIAGGAWVALYINIILINSL